MTKKGLIVSTVLNILLLPVLLLGSVGIVMGLASSGALLAQILLFAYYLFFIVPIVSIVGSWLNYKKENKKAMERFIALPWVYLLLFSFGIVLLFTLGE